MKSRKCSPAWGCAWVWISPAGRQKTSKKWPRSWNRNCWADLEVKVATSTCHQERATLHGPITNEVPIPRSEEHTSELQSLMRISYAVFCLKKKKQTRTSSNLN